MQIIVALMLQPGVIWLLGGALAGSALWAAMRLWRQTQRLSIALHDARRRVETAEDAAAFARAYEDIDTDLRTRALLGPSWRAYAETLQHIAMPQPLIRATKRPDEWFSATTLCGAAGINHRFHSAMPNLLVGAGLFFTFLGLAAALASAGSIVAEGVTQEARNAALRALLDSASFKFITSLVGLALSIFYTLLRQHRLGLVDAALSGFVAALAARTPRITPEMLQREGNELLARQSTFLESFSTDLAVNIGNAFDKAFDNRLGEHIGPLRDAMTRLADITATRNEDAVEAMLKRFLERLEGGSSAQMQRVAESLSGLSNRLEGLQSGLGDAAVRMTQSADAMAARMGQGAEAALQGITTQMQSLMVELRGLAADSRATGSQVFEALAARTTAAAAGFETSASEVAALLQKAGAEGGEALRGALTTGGNSLVEALRDAAGHVAASGQEAGQALRGGGDAAAMRVQQAADGIATAGRGLGEQTIGLTGAAERLATRITEFERAAAAAAAPLASASQGLSDVGQAALGAVRGFQAAVENMETVQQGIANAAQRLEKSQLVAAELAEALNVAVERFGGVDDALAGTMRGLQDGLRGFTDQVRAFVVQTDENLAEGAKHLQSAVQMLEESLTGAIEELGKHR